MIRRVAFGVILLSPLVAGCGGLYRIGARNLINEAKLVRDEEHERMRYAHLAHEAWKKVAAHCPSRSYSTDYVQGFKAGFVDYLYAGGTGEPPALPPKRYRHFHAESPKGTQGLQDWDAGFRHGAAVAKESGLRQFVLVGLPKVVPPPLPPPHLPTSGAPSRPADLSGPSLPPPRVMPAQTPQEPRVDAPDTDHKKTPHYPLGYPETSSSPDEGEPTKDRLEEEPAIQDATTEKLDGEQGQ